MTAVARVRERLSPSEATTLGPALKWWEEALASVKGDVTEEMVMAKGLAQPKIAKLFAKRPKERPGSGPTKWEPFDADPVSRKMAGKPENRRPAGDRYARPITVTDARHTAAEFIASATKAEKAEIKSELLTSQSLGGTRARLEIQEGSAKVPSEDSPLYTDFLMAKSGLLIKNRMSGALKILKEMGLLSPDVEIKLRELVSEGYQRVHNFPSSGRRTLDPEGQKPLVGRWTDEGYQPHKVLSTVDLKGLDPAARKAYERAQHTMLEEMADYINSLQPVLQSIGILFAGIFTADQLMPSGEMNAAAW